MPLSSTEHPDPAVVRQARTLAGFNGQLHEPSGVYLLGNGHRAYNPALMRFHSPDQWSPFSRGGLNAYAYCSGDPVSRVDPSGRWEELVGPLVTLAANFFLFKTGVYSIRSPTMKGPSLTATYVSTSGALVGMYGSVEQLLGNPEGKWINYIGTAFAGSAAFLRSRIARRADRKHWAEVKKKDLAAKSESAPATPRSRTAMSWGGPAGDSGTSSPSLSYHSARSRQSSSMGTESIRSYHSGNSLVAPIPNLRAAAQLRSAKALRKISDRLDAFHYAG